VCISFNTHIILLSLAVAGFFIAFVGKEWGEPPPPKNPADELRKKWHDKMPRK
jgi:hypothetical protein